MSLDASTRASVQARFEIKEQFFVAHFQVRDRTLNFNPNLPRTASQWGLWDWDVVELFIATSPSETYYEFQVSPLDQYFELEIFEPRKRFNKAFESGFRHCAEIKSETSWNARMEIDLSKLGWDGRPGSLRGNAFAILSKTYWSLNLPKQKSPDFHLPQYFRSF